MLQRHSLQTFASLVLFTLSALESCGLQDVFGLETTNGFGAGSVDGLYGVTPCTDPTNIADRGCDDDAVSWFRVVSKCDIQAFD